MPAQAQSSNAGPREARVFASRTNSCCARGGAGVPTAARRSQLHPEEPNFVGSGLPHVGPWDYIQDRADALVRPRVHQGPGSGEAPGHARPTSRPRLAEILKFDGFKALDGTADDTRRSSPADQRATPKLVVTMVWDAGGMNVLQAHPRRVAVPQVADPEGHVLHRLPPWAPRRRRTAQIHATIGTGVLPARTTASSGTT